VLDRDKLVADTLMLEDAPTLAGAGGHLRRDPELVWNSKVASVR
jgi:hypothetical protein